MTKSTAYLLFTDIIETSSEQLSHNQKIKNLLFFMQKDIGTVFTFSRFCAYLIRIALIKIKLSDDDNDDHNNNTNSNSIHTIELEKLLILLNKMELSPGFSTLEKRTHNPHYSKMTLLIPK